MVLEKTKSGQAMVETVLAVLIISFLFLALFRLSHMLTGKIMLEHAAMRVARARAVGFNEFMCVKAARVAVIPVAGKRFWPEDEEFDFQMERARLPIYMQTKNAAIARGVLEYDGWNRLSVEPGDGTDVRVGMGFDLFDGDWTFDLDGRAGIEDNFTLYMENQGL